MKYLNFDQHFANERCIAKNKIRQKFMEILCCSCETHQTKCLFLHVNEKRLRILTVEQMYERTRSLVYNTKAVFSNIIVTLWT